MGDATSVISRYRLADQYRKNGARGDQAKLPPEAHCLKNEMTGLITLLNTGNLLVLKKIAYTFLQSDMIFVSADSNGGNIYENIPGFCFIH